MSPFAARFRIALAAVALAATGGCGPAAVPGPVLREPAHARRAGEFSVATYNLAWYSLDDRDGDGQRNDPKPAAERDAMASLLARIDADVLAVQEIGPTAMVEELRRNLRARGLDYPFVEHAIRPQSDLGLAVFSRFPIVERKSRLDDTYRIGATNLPVLRGFADVTIEAAPGYRFRLIVAHLKSKIYHPLGQTEMRRNEARLLANHVRKALRTDPALNL
ncbi:MAG: endonuclease/exonuclease/phosphatase family protein, partial [Verrucomicrobia bacterium]|nr:endonuclease/exonuclease/phosphatase family protein [Verrucomicrobiota bacterium]